MMRPYDVSETWSAGLIEWQTQWFAAVLTQVVGSKIVVVVAAAAAVVFHQIQSSLLALPE